VNGFKIEPSLDPPVYEASTQKVEIGVEDNESVMAPVGDEAASGSDALIDDTELDAETAYSNDQYVPSNVALTSLNPDEMVVGEVVLVPLGR
jgi:hypothetical protein